MQVKTDFFLSAKDFQPAYLRLYGTGELQQRAREAIQSLASCRVCPRKCGDDRLGGETGICKIGRYARVSSYFPHRGEEDCLRGWRGSGTIFFSGCSLRCHFCQNFEISHTALGEESPPERLAEMMLELQGAGCHNINFVTPTHVAPQILEALVIAVEKGLRLPLVYNTSAYDSLETLAWLDGVIDIYMPDFKMWGSHSALKYLSAKNYPEIARQAIKEMHRQVGDLQMDEQGLAKRGVLLRHLVMPGAVAGTPEIMNFLSKNVSPHIYVNIMAQYAPAGSVTDEKLPEINRRVTTQEYSDALTTARQTGLHRFAER